MPSLRSSTGNVYYGNPLVVNAPAGVAADDILVAIFTVNDSTRTLDTLPTGWSIISNVGTATTPAMRTWIVKKTAGASEPASWNFTFNANFNGTWHVEAWSGGEDVALISDAAVSGVFSTPYSYAAPSVVTPEADCVGLALFGLRFSSAGTDPVFTVPSGYTTAGDAGVDYDTKACAGAYKVYSAAGSTGAATGSFAVTAGGDARMTASHLVITPAVTSYVGTPNSDVSAGTWTASTGSALYAMIDETVASDTDYVTATLAGTCEVALSSFAAPLSGWLTTIRYRIQGDCTVSLMEGATSRASWTHSPGPGTPTTYEQTLTSGEQAAITGWTNLRLKFVKP